MQSPQFFAIFILCGFPTESPAILRQYISNKRANPISQLWDLTNFAVQSRQGNPNPYLGYPQQNTQTILETLSLISQNDDHHCVPKLLCELLSGSSYTSSRQFSLIPSFQFDMDSISGLLSAFGPSTSPIILFGRAALLGYTAKENSDSCTYAYPRCPKDPDVLLNYLNNHNGGFFRYFNGVGSRPYYRREILGNRISFPQAYRDNYDRPVIYSDRTGTGELILDSSEFLQY